MSFSEEGPFDSPDSVDCEIDYVGDDEYDDDEGDELSEVE